MTNLKKRALDLLTSVPFLVPYWSPKDKELVSNVLARAKTKEERYAIERFICQISALNNGKVQAESSAALFRGQSDQYIKQRGEERECHMRTEGELRAQLETERKETRERMQALREAYNVVKAAIVPIGSKLGLV